MLNILLYKSIFTRFLGYICTGIISTFVHFVVLIILVEGIKILTPLPASILSSIAGSFTGFFLNRSFVFNQPQAGRRKFFKYLIVSFSAFLINAILMHILIEQLRVYYLIAQLIATLVIVITNFSMYQLWVFQEKINVSKI